MFRSGLLSLAVASTQFLWANELSQVFYENITMSLTRVLSHRFRCWACWEHTSDNDSSTKPIVTLFCLFFFFWCLEKIPVSIEIPHRKTWHFYVEATYAEADESVGLRKWETLGSVTGLYCPLRFAFSWLLWSGPWPGPCAQSLVNL